MPNMSVATGGKSSSSASQAAINLADDVPSNHNAISLSPLAMPEIHLNDRMEEVVDQEMGPDNRVQQREGGKHAWLTVLGGLVHLMNPQRHTFEPALSIFVQITGIG